MMYPKAATNRGKEKAMTEPVTWGAFAWGLVKALLGMTATKAAEKGTEGWVNRAKGQLEQMLRFGKFGEIDQALNLAETELLGMYDIAGERWLAKDVLDALKAGQSDQLMEQFTRQIVNSYIARTQDSPNVQELASEYRKLAGIVQVRQGQ